MSIQKQSDKREHCPSSLENLGEAFWLSTYAKCVLGFNADTSTWRQDFVTRPRAQLVSYTIQRFPIGSLDACSDAEAELLLALMFQENCDTGQRSLKHRASVPQVWSDF